MVPNLSTVARTYSATSSSRVTSAVHRERLGGGGQVLDRGREVLLPAVDGDDAGAAFGQQADGRGSDDAGRAGHDGNPAIEANSIGHVWGFLSLAPVIPDFGGFRAKSGRPRANGSDYFI